MKIKNIWIVAFISAGSFISAQGGTVVYEPDNYAMNQMPPGGYLSTYGGYYMPGVTFNNQRNGELQDVKVSSYGGNRYFSPTWSGNFDYSSSAYNNVFRVTFSSTTSMASLRVWSSKLTPGSGILNAYSTSGTLLGSASLIGNIGDGDPAQTLQVSANGIKYIELVPTVGGALRADNLQFFGTPTYNATVSFKGYYDTSDGGTVGSLIGGTASATRNITTSFTDAENVDAGPAILAGDVMTLEGTGSDTFVMAMKYTDQDLADSGLNEEQLMLLWDNGTGVFVNAVMGNSNFGVTGEALIVSGAYDSAIHTLGNYGVDADNNTVWAVLDHNSDFAPGAVPEPATFAMFLGLCALGLTACRGKRK